MRAGRLVGDPSVTVRAMTNDSRRVTPGTLYACVRGAHHDGHEFAPAAVAAGAPRAARRPRAGPARCPARRRRRPAGHGSYRRRGPRSSEPGDDARRDHWHEREDDHLTLAGVDHAHGGDADRRSSVRCRARTRPQRRQICRRSSPTPGGRAPRPSSWRSHRMPWRCIASTARGSPPRCSPTSVPTTSTCTGRWRTTSAPRPACSRRRWLRSA